MARLHSCSAATIEVLAEGWECMSTAPGVADEPRHVRGRENWIPARVPGTFAAALLAAEMWDGDASLDLDSLDIWFRTHFQGEAEETLYFEGLATIAEVWLNGDFLFGSENMFRPSQVFVHTQASNELYICFRSLSAWLRRQKGRAHWRPRIAASASLRFARTTLLGRMPGWCPAAQPVGPWRPVLRRRCHGPADVAAVDARSSIRNGAGVLTVRCRLTGDVPPTINGSVWVGDSKGYLERVGPDEFAGEVIVNSPELWWPHTHGEPHLYAAELRIGSVECRLGRIGFREITVDAGRDFHGFGLRVNGEALFCRGACWTTPDIVTLPSGVTDYQPGLQEMRDAGLNMVRVGGTMVYEGDAFYALCDELGLLVWQDAMLANFDYPSTADFQASLQAELEQFLTRVQLNPSLTVFCGGSEVLQQATMFGVAQERIDSSLYDSMIPDVVHRIRPDVVYVENSPSGGDLPFQPDCGVAHYYGVGAYLRPLGDARLANVRFASECLAVANVPSSQTVMAMGITTTTDPRWKRAVPRDPGAGWDFDDVRDYYLAMLFKVDPPHLRYVDFQRYLDLSRAVSCILLEETFNEWRRMASSCRGALVWQWQDVLPGAGWGVIDSHGRRKPVWYALQRASRIRHLFLTDEGLNGLAAHVINETDSSLRAVLRMVCLKDGMTRVREGERRIELAPRSGISLRSAALVSGFFDVTYAYRLGPPPHDATIVSLCDFDTEAVLAQAYHFPDIAALHRANIGLEVTVEHDASGWWLELRSQRLAYFLHIDDEAFTAGENWFHLAPGHDRRISLTPDAKANEDAAPQGEVRALNMDRVVRYAGRR